MPLYEYLCPNCEVKFEAHRPMAYRETALCLKCGRVADKVLSTFSFTFGWRLSDASHERFGPRDEFVKDV